MVLNDSQIREIGKQGMISPFAADDKIRHLSNGTKVPSYGVSSYGYDVRLGDTFLFPCPNTHIDPMGKSYWLKFVADCPYIVLPPKSFCLAHTMETIEVPKNCICTVSGKSTYARCGIVMTMTPLEPGWKGQVTLEIGNLSNCAVALYICGGIAQILYHASQGEPTSGYADTGSLYSGTEGVVPSGSYEIVRTYTSHDGCTANNLMIGSIISGQKPINAGGNHVS